MISGANINLDFLYLVNKKDLKGILETGIIKKSKKDSNCLLYTSPSPRDCS